jgi:hypothetical protein
MTEPFTVELLHGLLDGGRRQTLAALRDPTGHDETLLAELGPRASAAEQVTTLLAALVVRIGSIEPVAKEDLLRLTAGDRERLILALCVRLLGPEIDLVTACPSCRALAEVPVRFHDVISARPASPPTDIGEIELEADGGRWRARCRPPTGADLEKAARGGPNAGHDLIIDCILELADPTGRRVSARDVPSACLTDLADRLAEFDPAAECDVTIDCPSCGGTVTTLLDGFTILRTALAPAPRLYDEVYRMARSYHWSEAEILSLPLERRRRYLAIADGGGAQR